MGWGNRGREKKAGDWRARAWRHFLLRAALCVFRRFSLAGFCGLAPAGFALAFVPFGHGLLVDRDEKGQKRSVNTKIIIVFIFLLKTKSKTVTPETKMILVFQKHQKRKFGTENTPVTVKI
jgi:hypothetical protein